MKLELTKSEWPLLYHSVIRSLKGTNPMDHDIEAGHRLLKKIEAGYRRSVV